METGGARQAVRADWALRDCSLRLPAGRIAALVGPNGAGKSTLLHLAVGLLRPDGRHDRGLRPPPAGKRSSAVGFVAQDTPLYPDFTATELIELGAGSTAVRRRVGQRPARRTWASRWTARSARCPAASGPRSPCARVGQAAPAAAARRAGGEPRPVGAARVPAVADGRRRRRGHHRAALLAPARRPGAGLRLPVVLQAGQVQVLGAVDDLIADHRC